MTLSHCAWSLDQSGLKMMGAYHLAKKIREVSVESQMEQ